MILQPQRLPGPLPLDAQVLPDGLPCDLPVLLALLELLVSEALGLGSLVGPVPARLPLLDELGGRAEQQIRLLVLALPALLLALCVVVLFVLGVEELGFRFRFGVGFVVHERVVLRVRVREVDALGPRVGCRFGFGPFACLGRRDAGCDGHGEREEEEQHQDEDEPHDPFVVHD